MEEAIISKQMLGWIQKDFFHIEHFILISLNAFFKLFVGGFFQPHSWMESDVQILFSITSLLR